MSADYSALVKGAFARLEETGVTDRFDQLSLARVTDWVELVATYNRRIDLTAARDPEELVDLMVADAAVLAARLGERRGRGVDVGSGAGAPGLPLAILRPALHLTLVEPMQKRCTVLRLAQSRTKRDNVRVEQKRGEALVGAARYDFAVSRATLAPPAWLALGASLADEVWVLLARLDPPALSGLRIRDRVDYALPYTGVERTMLAYQSER
ncbi:MAG: RsmG family class I SAM-dependent methyltransferase [Myxococcota bacterium]